MKISEKEMKQKIDDYSKMLFYLNESTDDYLFLWDIKNNNIILAKEINNAYSLKRKNGSQYDINNLLNCIYEHDINTVSKTIENFINGNEDHFDIDCRIVDTFKRRTWINCRGRSLFDESGHPEIAVGRFSRSAFADKIDSLTGLMNYNKMIENLNNNIQNNKRGHLMILGIDNFKHLNQRFGRNYGNNVLKNIADILEMTEKNYSHIYRLDGDHFAIDLIGYSKNQVTEFYHQIQNNISDFCTISAGVVNYPIPEAENINLLIQYAENALERAKNAGKNRLEFFSREDYKKYMYLLDIQDELKESVANGFERFELYYQPQIKTDTYSLYGAEALLRFTSKQYGLISPTTFIPILEQSGLIINVGKWVIQQAITQCAKWRQYNSDLHISINLSYLQLKEPTITEDIFQSLDQNHLPGDALSIEITESMQLQDYNYFNNIFYQWRKKGIQISIDDFGTGYSSLSYLKSLEIDEVKIDRSFISKIEKGSYNYKLLSNTIELAHSAQIQVCCEGIEHIEELQSLTPLKPELLQGFLFGKPIPKTLFEEKHLLKNNTYHLIKQINDQLIHKSDFSPSNSYSSLILDNVDDIIYVTDLKTREIIYMNNPAKHIARLNDYTGQKCHNVFFKSKEICHNCHMNHLSKKSFTIENIYNDLVKDNYQVYKKVIEWNKKQCLLVIARIVDDSQKITDMQLHKQLNLQKKINQLYYHFMNMSDDYFFQEILENINSHYQSDRALIFMYNENLNIWQTIYSYDALGLMPKARLLQTTTHEKMKPWIELLEKNKIIHIEDPNDEKQLNEDLKKGISLQNIKNCVLTGIYHHERLIGFTCINNYTILEDDFELLKQTNKIIEKRIIKIREKNQANQIAVHKMNYDILTTTKLGLWIIRIDKTKNEYEMIADDNMKKILGISEELSPKEIYQFWYERINDGFYHYVNNAVETMINTGNIVELEYTWNHPQLKEVAIRCVGALTSHINGIVTIEGYHRIIDDLKRLRFITRNLENDMFEYHELRNHIYFHTNRMLVYGQEKSENNFPYCWIERGIVHPYFSEDFIHLFTHVNQKKERQVLTIMLKNKDGEYEWVKIETRHLSDGKEDENTLIVIIIPMKEKKLVELEYNRTNDFYHAMLSETISYAEVKVEDGSVLRSGGFWNMDDEKLYLHDLVNKLYKDFVYPKDQEKYLRFLDIKNMKNHFQSGNKNIVLEYRRMINDEIRWVEIIIHLFEEKHTHDMYALIYQKDINNEKLRALKNEKAANRDSLTGVYNHATFEKQINYYIDTINNDEICALLIFDIDNFKSINDTEGHLFGDQVLKELTYILLKSFRKSDLIGRLGGDEFIVFVKDVKKYINLKNLLNDLYQSLNNNQYKIHCSCGITMIKKDNFQYNTSLQEADKALYISKKKGKNTFTLYEKDEL